MIGHLSPAYLRVGGNMADRLIFVPNTDKTNIDSNFSEQMEQPYGDNFDVISTQNFSMYGKIY